MRCGSMVWIVVICCAVAVAYWTWCTAEDNDRLRCNQQSLIEGVTYYKTKTDESAASVQALQLQVQEFRHLHAEDAQRIKELGIRLRRAESYAVTSTHTTLRDTIVVRDTVVVGDSISSFSGGTRWHTIAGILWGDSLAYEVHTVDTLRQVVHRVPRKFLFIRYGTKGIRQEVWSSNPNTTIVYTEYIELKRGR